MKRALSVVLVAAVTGCSFFQVHGPAAPDRAGSCTTSYRVPHRDYITGFILMAPLVGLGIIAAVDGLTSSKNDPFDGDPYKPYLLPFGIAAAAGAPFVVGAGVGDGRVDDCRRASGLKTRDEEFTDKLAAWQAVVDAHNAEVQRQLDACVAAGPAGALADVTAIGPDLAAYPCTAPLATFGVRGTGAHTLAATTCTYADRCADVDSGAVYRNLVARMPGVAVRAGLADGTCRPPAAADGDAEIALTVADYQQVDPMIAAARAELAAHDLVHAVVVQIAVAPACDRAAIEAALPPLPPRPEQDLFTP